MSRVSSSVALRRVSARSSAARTTPGRRREAFFPLEQVIVESLLHRLDGDLLAAGGRVHDNRPVGIPALDRSEQLEAVGPAELVINDRQGKLALLHGRGEATGIADLLKRGLRKLLAQFPNHEEAVRLVVINDQEDRVAVHVSLRSTLAGQLPPIFTVVPEVVTRRRSWGSHSR